MEKTKKIRVAIGVTAFAAVVTMNLIHAWNDYGITDSSRLLGINASPAEDEKKDTTELQCDTKEGDQRVEINAKADPQENVTVHCILTEVIRGYICDSNGSRVLIGEYSLNHQTGKRTLIYIKKGYTASDLYNCTDIESGEKTETIFKPTGIKCVGVYIGECCYPKDLIIDCDILLKGTN